jgi:hypothetical protein
MTTDEGLSEGARAWLAGAGNRLNEPVREDRPGDVQARLDPPVALPVVTLPPHPEGEYVALETDLRQVLDDDDALTAVQRALAAGWRPPGAITALIEAARTETATDGLLLRPGGHCEAKGGLTTLWAYHPGETADGQGRRPTDMNVGTVLTPGLARAVAAAYNARTAVPDPRVLAGRLRVLLDRLVEAIPNGCPADPCPICTTLEDFHGLIRTLEDPP